MTDVNFVTLLLACCYVAVLYFEKQQLISVILFYVLCSFLVLVRQTGLVLPLCFACAWLFTPNRRWQHLVAVIGGCMFVGLVLGYYEAFLKQRLPAEALYEYVTKSGRGGDNVWWERMKTGLFTRVPSILLQTLIYSAPFSLIFLPSLVKERPRTTVILLLLLSAGCVIVIFRGTSFPMGNIFTNMALGAETFYQEWRPGQTGYVAHTHSDLFEIMLTVVRYLFGTAGLFCFLLMAPRQFKRASPGFVFFALFVFGYIAVLLVTETYFDRYLLPLIVVAALVILRGTIEKETSLMVGAFFVILIFYVSVAGTHDYFRLNEQRWSAYRQLRDAGIAIEKINGGYEVNGWHEGKDFNWWDHMVLGNHDYLIQYSPEPGFLRYRTLPFRRWFPVKDDTLFIFKRDVSQLP